MSGEPLARYKLAFETCGLPRGDSIGVYDLNVVDHKDCSNKDAIDDWKATVVSHENRHETSLNECIQRVRRFGGLLRQIEAIVTKGAGGRSKAEEEVKKLWTDRAYTALLDAKETAQKGASANFYHWRRFARWVHGGRLGDHGGANGCPQI